MPDGKYQFEVVVVGAGPAGIAAACAAAEGGKRVALVDDTPWRGGQIWRGETVTPKSGLAQSWLKRLAKSSVTVLDRTSVVGPAGANVLLAEHPEGGREIYWEQLILATGARELFLPFPGWTLPGVMGPGGLQALVKHGWPIRGQRVVVCGTGPLLLAVADGLRTHGANIVCLAEQADWGSVLQFGLKLWRHPGKIRQGLELKTRLWNVPMRFGVWPARADGETQVRSVTLTDGRKTWTEICDVLACGFHLVPNVELPLALGCELRGGFVAVDQWQRTTRTDIYCAGEPVGIGGAEVALLEGEIAGRAASGKPSAAEALLAQRNSWQSFCAALAVAYALRPELRSLATNQTVLCRCEDVTFGQVQSYSNWRDAKLLSRCGMGACQGRTCGAATQFLFGWGMTSVRPPVLPVHVKNLITKTQTK